MSLWALGLAICKRLVGLMAGDIAACSEPGVGSTFRLRIPVRVAQRPTLQAHATNGTTRVAVTRTLHGRVLVVEDNAVINRMGFNNSGHDAALVRLTSRNRRGIVGVNIGANKNSGDRVADYVAGVKAMSPVADYITINISSPNTPGLRGLQDKTALDELLDAVMAVRSVPIFLKVAPDLDAAAIDDVVEVTVRRAVDAVIIGNTTISRPKLGSAWQSEIGGLSGGPLKALAMEKLRAFRAATGGQMTLIAAGGIDSADEAYARMRAGASLVQIYSALVYHGPGLAKAIATGLVRLLARDGFAQIADAVGVDAI